MNGPVVTSLDDDALSLVKDLAHLVLVDDLDGDSQLVTWCHKTYLELGSLCCTFTKVCEDLRAQRLRNIKRGNQRFNRQFRMRKSQTIEIGCT